MKLEIFLCFTLTISMMLCEESPKDVAKDTFPMVTIDNILITNQSTKVIVFPPQLNPYTIDVRCRVPGKSNVSVDNITLTCNFPHGSKTYSVPSRSAIFQLELVTKGTAKCTCSASYSSNTDRQFTLFSLNYTAGNNYPPVDTPRILYGSKPISDNYHLRIKYHKGSTPPPIDLTCSVLGGNPLVSNVTLMCGTRKMTSESTSVHITLRPSRPIRNRTCRCTANHVTGLYNKSSAFNLTITDDDES